MFPFKIKTWRFSIVLLNYQRFTAVLMGWLMMVEQPRTRFVPEASLRDGVFFHGKWDGLNSILIAHGTSPRKMWRRRAKDSFVQETCHPLVTKELLKTMLLSCIFDKDLAMNGKVSIMMYIYIYIYNMSICLYVYIYIYIYVYTCIQSISCLEIRYMI